MTELPCAPPLRRLRNVRDQLWPTHTQAVQYRFTDEQRASLFHDGYAIVRGAVPGSVVARARAPCSPSVLSLGLLRDFPVLSLCCPSVFSVGLPWAAPILCLRSPSVLSLGRP